ncbi:MAG TPA: ATP-dependent protease ATPase subunit HslU [Catalimonadaceae bacterium]|nr:ATP-dependent protease ATPase subunit HslU [Catalimonadaceae bacterium]HPI11332.1 ATP-dependent protease ATPase subunit HslU [Catalimonadaceae bacterium]
MDTQSLTPFQIVQELDKYIVGQNDAKKNVAIALRNRWRRMNAADDIKNEIVPNNILMIGATGVGKTEIARRLAKIAKAPFVKVEASKFTEVGYVGRDVESMVRDLVEQTVRMVKQEKTESVKEKAARIVEDLILDILIPPLKESKKNIDTPSREDVEQNEQTRERFREKLAKGELDNRKIEIQVSKKTNPNIGIMGAGPMDESALMNIQEMLGGMVPKGPKKRKMTISDARKSMMDEEVDRLIDMEEVKEEALVRAENSGIIFIDEIDKIASNSSDRGSSGSVSREGVQRDLLPVVEGSAVSTKYGTINTDHVLFIAAGAFHFAKPSDLIPELQGRFPIRVELDNLTQEDFVRILKEPKNSLIKQYQALFQAEGVELAFTSESVDKIAETAMIINDQVENIGARRLHTIMSQLLNDYLFRMPEEVPSGQKIEIDGALVDSKLKTLVKNRDLSQYIL